VYDPLGLIRAAGVLSRGLILPAVGTGLAALAAVTVTVLFLRHLRRREIRDVKLFDALRFELRRLDYRPRDDE
jgi:hypothetical protein